MSKLYALRRSEELLALFREEYRRGFRDSLVEGGVQALLVEYSTYVPPSIRLMLDAYGEMGFAKRKETLASAGKALRTFVATSGGKCEMSSERRRALKDWIYERRNVDRAKDDPRPIIWTGIRDQDDSDRWAKPHSIDEVRITHEEYRSRMNRCRNLLDTLD
jgi:hypothetical protein